MWRSRRCQQGGQRTAHAVSYEDDRLIFIGHTMLLDDGRKKIKRASVV